MQYELHPSNRSFEWQAAHLPLRRLDAAQVAAYNEQGGFVLRDVFSAAEMHEVIAAIDPLEAQSEAFLRAREDGTYGIARAGQITFRPHLVTQSARLVAFSRHPVLVDICADLIGRDVRLYWDQSVYKKPEADQEFPWDQDNGYTYVLQYAPDGAVIHQPDKPALRCDAPDRQYPVLRAGEAA